MAEAALSLFSSEMQQRVRDLRTSTIDAGTRLEKLRERAEAERLNAIRERSISLCVGGSHFTTTLATLTRDPHSMLGVMFSGRHAQSRMPDGSYFLDRDPTHFRYVLNLLRDGSSALPQRHTGTSNDALRREILVEAQYYQIREMIAVLEDGPSSRLARCAAAGGRIKEAEDAVRKGLQSVDPSSLSQALHDAERLLIDVFATRERGFVTDLSASAAECQFVLDGAPERGWRQREGTFGLSVVDRPRFAANWLLRSGTPKRLRWPGATLTIFSLHRRGTRSRGIQTAGAACTATRRASRHRISIYLCWFDSRAG
jgi:hypothetical protein